MNREMKKRKKKKEKRKEKNERKNKRTKEKETIENERIPLCLFGIRLGRANAPTWSLREEGEKLPPPNHPLFLGGNLPSSQMKIHRRKNKKNKNKKQEARRKQEKEKEDEWVMLRFLLSEDFSI